MMKYLTIFSLLLLLLSCGNAESDAAETAEENAVNAAQAAAWQSMMDGHDRIMPMMGRITQAQRSITDQLTAGGHGEEYRELLLATNEQLEDADDAMHEWMNSIRPLDDLRQEMDEDEIMNFIKEKTRTIADVEADVKTSLATADQVLANHQHTDGEDHDH